VTSYPNREQANADKAARRRALQALDDIEAEVKFLRRRISNDVADGDGTSTLAMRTADVIRCLSVLGTLRKAREWDAADKAREATTAAGGVTE
jgi:hypothetical protein